MTSQEDNLVALSEASRELAVNVSEPHAPEAIPGNLSIAKPWPPGTDTQDAAEATSMAEPEAAPLPPEPEAPLAPPPPKAPPEAPPEVALEAPQNAPPEAASPDAPLKATAAPPASPPAPISTALDVSKIITPEGGKQESTASRRAAQRLERANARASSLQQSPSSNASPPVFSPRSATATKPKEEEDWFVVEQPIFTDRAMPSKLAPTRELLDAPPIFSSRSMNKAPTGGLSQSSQSDKTDEDEIVFTHRGGATSGVDTIPAPADEPAWTNFPTTNQVELPSAGEMPVFLMTTLTENEEEEDDDSDDEVVTKGEDEDAGSVPKEGMVESPSKPVDASHQTTDQQKDAEQKSAELIDQMLANDLQMPLDEEASKAAIEKQKGGGSSRKKLGKAKKLPSKAKKSSATAASSDKPEADKPAAKSSTQKAGKAKGKRAGGKKRAQANGCSVVMEVHSEEGNVLSKRGIIWSANELSESFEKLVLPLLLSEHSVDSLGSAHLSVNGVSVEGSAVVSTILPTENKKKGSDRLVIKLDNSGASGGADALKLGVGEACFVVELYAPDGLLVASSGAVFNKSWLNKPLMKVAVEPALLNAGISRGHDSGAKHVEEIKIDGNLVDGKTKAISLVEASGSNGVRVNVALRESSVPTFLELDIADSNGEVVSQMSTALNASNLERPLGPLLVKPALDSANIVPKVPVEHVEVCVAQSGGQMTLDYELLMKTKFSKVLSQLRSGSNANYGSSEAKAIRLLLTLPAGAAPADRLPLHVNVTLSHDGRALACMDAELTIKLLDKPLETALIKPAIASHLRTADLDSFTASQFRLLLAKDGMERVTATLNGMDVNIDASLRALSSVTAAVAEEPQLVISLPTPPHSEGGRSKIPFHVTISVSPVGDTLARPETVELDTWLEKQHLNDPIKQSLIAPALALYSLDASAFVDSIEVDGETSDGTFSAHQYAHAYGRAIKVTIHGSQLPGGVSHLTEFLSESELARRTMPLHEPEHGSTSIFGAQLSKARDAVSSGVSNALRRLSLTGSTDATRKSAVAPAGPSRSTKGSLFVVHMDGHFSDGDMWTETYDTRLNSTWLKKSLAIALVEPALQAYYASEHYARRQPLGEEKVKFSGITVSVNGRELDEMALTSMTPSYFVYSDETASEVRISFQASL